MFEMYMLYASMLHGYEPMGIVSFSWYGYKVTLRMMEKKREEMEARRENKRERNGKV
jgi:hypothetical protein